MRSKFWHFSCQGSELWPHFSRIPDLEGKTEYIFGISIFSAFKWYRLLVHLDSFPSKTEISTPYFQKLYIPTFDHSFLETGQFNHGFIFRAFLWLESGYGHRKVPDRDYDSGTELTNWRLNPLVKYCLKHKTHRNILFCAPPNTVVRWIGFAYIVNLFQNFRKFCVLLLVCPFSWSPLNYTSSIIFSPHFDSIRFSSLQSHRFLSISLTCLQMIFDSFRHLLHPLFFFFCKVKSALFLSFFFHFLIVHVLFWESTNTVSWQFVISKNTFLSFDFMFENIENYLSLWKKIVELSTQNTLFFVFYFIWKHDVPDD